MCRVRWFSDETDRVVAFPPLLDDELRLLPPVENFLIEANQRRPEMNFHCRDWLLVCETSIYDVMIGDPTLLVRADTVGQGWRIMQPVLDAWAAEKADFPNYDSGSDGPKATNELLTDDGGRAWRPVSLSPEQKP